MRRTLNLDADVAARVERLARGQGPSMSRVVYDLPWAHHRPSSRTRLRA